MTKEHRNARKDAGVLEKFRQLPGSRIAAAAFAVTVIAGLGAPAAWALWNQEGTAVITVTAGKPVPSVPSPEPTSTPTPTPPGPTPTPTPSAPTPTPTPTAAPALPVLPTALTCSRGPGGGSNGGRETTISWAAAGAPTGTSTIVEIILLSKNGQRVTGSLSYAVPGSSGTVRLAAFPGVEAFLADAQGNNTKFDVSVRNAWLTSAVSAPTRLGGAVTAAGAPSAALTVGGFQYKENGDWFNCPNGTH